MGRCELGSEESAGWMGLATLVRSHHLLMEVKQGPGAHIPKPSAPVSSTGEWECVAEAPSATFPKGTRWPVVTDTAAERSELNFPASNSSPRSMSS